MRLIFLALLMHAFPVTAQEAPAVSFDWVELRSDRTSSASLNFREDFDGGPNNLQWHFVSEADGHWWTQGDGRLTLIGARESLRSMRAPLVVIRALRHQDFSASTLMSYSHLEEGDVAGMVLRTDKDNWLAIQVERIEPADLIAVRWRSGETSPPAGKLIATTALPGTFLNRVRLSIQREAGLCNIIYASEEGPWLPLAQDIVCPTSNANDNEASPDPLLALFATDGAP